MVKWVLSFHGRLALSVGVRVFINELLMVQNVGFLVIYPWSLPIKYHHSLALKLLDIFAKNRLAAKTCHFFQNGDSFPSINVSQNLASSFWTKCLAGENNSSKLVHNVLSYMSIRQTDGHC